MRPPPAVESAAYFTVCEALTNVTKYADATYAWDRILHRAGCLEMEVGDDGVGGVDARRGSGVQGLRDLSTSTRQGGDWSNRLLVADSGAAGASPTAPLRRSGRC